MRVPFPIRRTTAATLALVLAGCMTTGKPPKKTARKKKAPAKTLTTEELADAPPAPPAVVKAAETHGVPTAANAPANPQRYVAACETAVNRFAPAYRNLLKLMPPTSYVPTGSILDQLAAAQPAACADYNSRQALAAVMKDALNGQTGRIGVILPLSGQNAKLATYVVNGLRAAFAEAGANFDAAAVLKDSGGSGAVAEERLAELVFKDRVALVIGGFERAEAEALVKWSGQLEMPTLLLNRDRDLIAASPYAFMLYPDEKRLADTLVDAASRRGYHRVAVLKPASGKSNKVVDYFKEGLKARGGTVAYDIVYTPGNFESMEAASAQLFKANVAEREGEYRAAYTKARHDAEKEGVPFDPRSVILKPVIDFDAVFIPDDFRTVRHFAKLFRYHLVDRLPLIGNHEWRSPALVEPYDDFLDGSLFADFIGSYARLPAAVGAPTLGSSLFVAPQNVVAVDFQLIGYRAGKVARGAAANPQAARPRIPAALLALSGDGNAYFKGQVFDAQRHSNWPTYVFTVSQKSVVLENENAASSDVPLTHQAVGAPAVAAAR